MPSAARRAVRPAPAEPPTLEVVPDVDPGELAAQLRLAIGRLYRSFRLGGDTTLSMPQQLLLMAIDRSGPLRLTDLAAQQGVPPSNLTRIITWLAGRGLITRNVGPGDRRSVIVAISPSGRQLVRRVASVKAQYLGGKIDRLRPAQQRAIRDTIPVLEKLLQDDLP